MKAELEVKTGVMLSIEDYNRLQDALFALTASEARVKLLEDALEALLIPAREWQTATSRPHGIYKPDATDLAIQQARKALGDVTATKGEAK